MSQPQSAERAITHDPAYEAVAPDDFAAMVAVERYGRRSDAFDPIISATHDHFWDPHNPAYLDYSRAVRPRNGKTCCRWSASRS